jgi:Uncharacterised nucleotidyltransferase
MDAADYSPPLPPPAVVAAALRTTTERLAHELAHPQCSAPHWSEFEWRAARAAAVMHCASGALATTLRWRGPTGWQDFLSGQREHITRRHLRIERLICLIDEQLRARGIPALALKGSALHAEGIYQPGDRPMADVDLLVRPLHVEGSTEALAFLGFRESSRTIKHRVFSPQQARPPAPFGEHADNDLKVELHERIIEQLPLRVTEITEHVFPEDTQAGLRPYPSRAALMAHLLLHAASGFVFRELRLIQLHDIARLAQRLTQADWQQILSWNPWWAYPSLRLTERYYGAIAPDVVMVRARECCPGLLARISSQQVLSDVSLSQLWVDAFPGLAWARSAREAASYVAHRVAPSAQLRLARRRQLESEPGLSEGDWARLPQRRRILRFLTSRVPRPLSMHSMRAALEQRP